ncbi:MAG: FHA domain-containing protein [Planctomycetota bacterium]
MPRVVIQEGPGSGAEYEIDQAVILGRLDSNDIPVRDAKASREHAKIYRQGAQFAIVDLNSSNGTFVNGEKITKRILEPGDRIEIGTVRLVFEDPEAERVAVPARKGVEEAFATSRAKSAAGVDRPDEIVMRGHQPLQYSRIKPGRPLLGFDLDQLSDTGRFVIYIGLVIVFAGLMYLAYTLVAR